MGEISEEIKTNQSLICVKSSKQLVYCVKHHSEEDDPTRHKISQEIQIPPWLHHDLCDPGNSLQFLWSRWIPKFLPVLNVIVC